MLKASVIAFGKEIGAVYEDILFPHQSTQYFQFYIQRKQLIVGEVQLSFLWLSMKQELLFKALNNALKHLGVTALLFSVLNNFHYFIIIFGLV